ncbi:MAG: hypothetical protein ABIG28_03380 [archaeon]
MTKVYNLGEKPEELKGMEKLMGDKFVARDRERYKIHQGHPVRLAGVNLMGFYRGEAESATFVLWPSIVHKPVGDGNPKP